ncbi:MAG TPA: AarF/ABC1/UbiB kinase family protein [Pyrinomonadaceae bacterium]|nr:AarF/ABC1/UbiB kinase family protein [Pyrinomonadaceae bacterium]
MNTNKAELTEPTPRTPPHAGGGGESNGGGNGDGGRKTSLALVPARDAGAAKTAEVVVDRAGPRALAPAPSPEPTQEEHAEAARGWRGLWRTSQIARVLGALALFLYLEGYEARAKFTRRMAERWREEARARGRAALFQEWSRDVDRRAYDRVVRVVRRFVFRGGEGSEGKAEREQRQALWLKKNLIDLGPTFIKIGQALATRADLLPLAYIKELSTLQDQVPPFPTAEAYARIESELGAKLSELYAEIDAEPVAAASLGQVYRARMHTGEEVAVKVQRPRLRETVGFDVAVLERLVRSVTRRRPQVSENADWEGMLGEFRQVIFEEMDYAQEARNADRFRQNFRDWRVIHVPRIHRTHTTSRVLTMEFIRGTKVTDLEALRARRISPVKVNRLLVRTYLKQLLEDGFFHADPHPGNLLVMDDGRIAFFDFGMTGKITPQLQALMIDAFFHVVERDVRGLAQDLFDLNFLKPGVDPERVRPVVEALFRHYINLKLGDVNFKELTYDLAEVMYDYPFRLPYNFTYIMRALMTLEGIGIVTDPGFSFFDTAKPYAKEFMLKREGKEFRKLFVNRLLGRDRDGRIEWGRVWKLAKMAAKTYLEGKK